MSDGTDGLRVEHGALDGAAQDMATTVKQMDARLNQLEHDLAPLKSQWLGSQQVAYQQAKAAWDQAMAEMQALLGETSTTVAQSNVDYASADSRGAARFEF
ncbi:WXG100 family type VII secretion target [Nocardioides montaniterrae]